MTVRIPGCKVLNFRSNLWDFAFSERLAESHPLNTSSGLALFGLAVSPPEGIRQEIQIIGNVVIYFHVASLSV